MDREKLIEFYNKIPPNNEYYNAAQESIIMIYDKLGRFEEKFLYAFKTCKDKNTARVDQIFHDLIGLKGKPIVEDITSPESLITLASYMKNLIIDNARLTSELEEKNKPPHSSTFFKK